MCGGGGGCLEGSTPQPRLAWRSYFPPSFLGVFGAFFLGDFCLVFLLFLGDVSCSNVTATQPRTSERPSINVISFFMCVPPCASTANQPSGEMITDFRGAALCQLKWLHLRGGEGQVVERLGEGSVPDCL